MTRGTLILLDSENLFHPFIPYTNLAKLTATGAGLGRKAQLSQYLIPPGELKQGAAAHKTRMLVDELTSWVEQHYGHIASSTAFAYRNDGGHRIARPSLRNAGFRLVEHDPQRKNQADYAIVQELASIGARGCPDHMILITGDKAILRIAGVLTTQFRETRAADGRRAENGTPRSRAATGTDGAHTASADHVPTPALPASALPTLTVLTASTVKAATQALRQGFAPETGIEVMHTRHLWSRGAQARASSLTHLNRNPNSDDDANTEPADPTPSARAVVDVLLEIAALRPEAMPIPPKNAHNHEWEARTVETLRKTKAIRAHESVLGTAVTAYRARFVHLSVQRDVVRTPGPSAHQQTRLLLTAAAFSLAWGDENLTSDVLQFCLEAGDLEALAWEAHALASPPNPSGPRPPTRAK